jgi:hypothetical protein
LAGAATRLIFVLILLELFFGRYYEMKIPCLDDAEDYNNFGQIETVAEDQVSLLEETITPRHNLPPLLHKLSERKPEKLDWIGKHCHSNKIFVFVQLKIFHLI